MNYRNLGFILFCAKGNYVAFQLKNLSEASQQQAQRAIKQIQAAATDLGMEIGVQTTLRSSNQSRYHFRPTAWLNSPEKVTNNLQER